MTRRTEDLARRPPDDPGALLDFAALARRLSVSEDYLRRYLPRLCSDGFPRPLPLPGVRRWSPLAVEQWLQAPASPANQSSGGHAAANDTDEDDPLAGELAARARAIAAGRAK